MEVHKFGGGILSTASAIKRLPGILNKIEHKEHVVVVVSAFGKMTNLLEKLVNSAFREENSENQLYLLNEVREFHLKIINELFEEKAQETFEKVETVFSSLKKEIKYKSSYPYDKFYDQVVCYGEILSLWVISAYLSHIGFGNEALDARDYIKTDSVFRSAVVDYEKTKTLFEKKMENTGKPTFFLIQGFLGSDNENFSTTLGREGSDYTAGLIGNIMNVKKVVLWKDVPGVMDMNPKNPGGEKAKLISKLSYEEFEKLLEENAKGLVHPKTLNVVKNKKIRIQVRPYDDLDKEGTIIE